MTARLLMAWRWIASSRIAQGIAFVAGLIGYHLLRIKMAERSGRKEERNEAEQKAQSRRADVHNHVETERDKQREDSRKRNESETGRDGMGSDW
jgi:hypothetical protein